MVNKSEVCVKLTTMEETVRRQGNQYLADLLRDAIEAIEA